MRIIRLLIALILFIGFIYLTNNRLELKNTNIPPLGKFLDPFNGYLQNGSQEDGFGNFSFEIEGLKDSVSVYYDSMYIPHIFAKNEDDLYLVQGFIIAKHRLWQMEFQTHAAAGRLSEILGMDKNILERDRLQRRKGILQGARASMNAYQKIPELNSQLVQFAKGVNAYSGNLSYKNLPIEYKLLDYQPEEWSIFKTGLLLQYMTDMLAGYDTDIENTNLLAILGRNTYDSLFPDYPIGIEPVAPTLEPWEFDTVKITSDSIIQSKIYLDKINQSNPMNGSNNWAVSGNKTANGFPILANDTHLSLNLPSLWYLIHLHSPEVNTAGFTFTGAPGVIIGFTENTAWGFTNSPRDQRDWYTIEYENDYKLKYNHGGEWESVQYLYDTIYIRDSEPYVDTIKWTKLGPVTYDSSFPNGGSAKDLVYRWIGHEPSLILNSFNLINRSSNYDDYESAIKYWDSPSQNIVFSSNDGHIAISPSGKFPLKWEEQGKFILDASRPLHHWQGYIPKEHNPIMHNPERGFVSSANQHPVDSSYPYYSFNGSHEYYRNRRINELLDANDSIDVKYFMDMHFDAVSLKSRELLPLLLDTINNSNIAEGQSLISTLEQWDYSYNSQSEAPTIFNYWWRNLFQMIWDEFRNYDVKVKYPHPYNTVYLMKTDPNLKFYDKIDTPEKEGLGDLIRESFAKTVDDLKEKGQKEGNLAWWKSNKVRLNHLTRIPVFSVDSLQVPGSGDVINATNGTHGPSQRLIVELSSQPKAWVSYPGGQSGNPGSNFYLNFLDYWINGTYVNLPLLDKIPENNSSTLIFEPK